MKKFPRTRHVPYSPGVGSDDKIRTNLFEESGEYVMTEKMDGENTTFSQHFIHARSANGYPSHWSRGFMKRLWVENSYLVPDNLSIHGENLTGVHSIYYADLPSFFMAFAVSDREAKQYLGWDETQERVYELFSGRIPCVPEIAILAGDEVNEELLVTRIFRDYCKSVGREVEGFVIRPREAFAIEDYTDKVGKWVRPNHVQTDEHWMQSTPRYNNFPK